MDKNIYHSVTKVQCHGSGNAGLVSPFCRCWLLVNAQLDDGWPESEKGVFQAALSMVVVKNSR